MRPDWDEIERVQGFEGIRRHAETHVLPFLASADLSPVDPGGMKKLWGRVVTTSFILFGLTFVVLQFLLPTTWYGEILRFLMFPFLFFGFIIGAAYLFRGSLFKLFLDAKTHFLVRGKALAMLVAPLGFSYVLSPGGVPGPIKWLAGQSWSPDELRGLASLMEEAAGMDDAVHAARATGLMQEANVYVLGTAEQKKQYQKLAASQSQIEDGLHGVRSGAVFDMFEWVERVEDQPNVHHLVIVLEAPLALHGVTQLRARATGWPQEASGVRLSDVDLGPRAFDQRYRLRASDQVEARAIFNPAVIERVIELAHDGKFRAVAKGSRLVFDFPGPDRFRLVDLTTGEWGEHMLRQTAADLAEAAALVDALAHAFMLAGNSARGGHEPTPT